MPQTNNTKTGYFERRCSFHLSREPYVLEMASEFETNKAMAESLVQ